VEAQKLINTVLGLVIKTNVIKFPPYIDQFPISPQMREADKLFTFLPFNWKVKHIYLTWNVIKQIRERLR